MTFGLNAHVLNHADSFQGVAALYEKAHAWKDDGGERRALHRASSNPRRYATIRPLGGGYALCYHNTDVVIWRDANHITVNAYASGSTETFADNFLPWNLRSLFRYDDLGFFMRVAMARSQAYFHGDESADARVYKFKGSTMNFAFDKNHGCFMPVDADKINFIDAHSPALRAALTRTNYFDFMKWVDAVMSLESMPLNHVTARGDPKKLTRIKDADQEWKAHGPLGLLADPNKWGYLVEAPQAVPWDNLYSTKARADAVKDCLRQEIYREYDAIKTREVEWCPWSQFQKQRALRVRYPWI